MTGRVAGTAIRRTIIIGDAATMTAAKARERAMLLCNQMRAGTDPIEAKLVGVEIEVPTFRDAATEFDVAIAF